MNKELYYKILVLGGYGTGKTCFIIRYCDDYFQQSTYSEAGMDYKFKKLKLEKDKEIKLQIWNTCSQDRFQSIQKNYYKGAHGFIIMYDITSRSSFEEVKRFIKSIKNENSNEAPIIIVGGKLDLENQRQVSTEDGIALAKEFNCSFFECSAKDNININEIGDELTKKMIQTFGIVERQVKSTKIRSKNKKCS